MEAQLIPIDKIKPNPYQPEGRLKIDNETAKKFAESIWEHGLIQVPVCRQKDGHYEMGDGWLRLAGYKWLAKTKPIYAEIPAVVKELSDRQMADLVMEANTVRKDLNPIDLAQFYKKYLEDFKVTQAELARAHNISQGEVANTVRLLELQPEIQEKIISREITETHGRYLLQLPEKDRSKMSQRIISNKLTVASLDTEIKHTLWRGSQPLSKKEYAYYDNPEFNLAECEKCSHRVMLNEPWSDNKKHPRCDKISCWNDKQKAALDNKMKGQIEKLAAHGITKIYHDGELKYNQYAYLPDKECKACDKRAGLHNSNQIMVICTDVACKEKKTAAKYKKEEEKRDQQEKQERRRIDDIFAGLNYVARETSICALECLLRVCDGDRSEVLSSLGLEKDLTLKQIIAALRERDTTLQDLVRLCFEIMVLQNYDRGQVEYMLKRFQGASPQDEDLEDDEDPPPDGTEE